MIGKVDVLKTLTGMTRKWTFVLKGFVQVVLLILALNFFGLPSLKRYYAKEVVVVRSTDAQSGLPTPAVTVCPLNPQTSSGFPKNGFNSTETGLCFTLNRTYHFPPVTSPEVGLTIGFINNTDYLVFLHDPNLFLITYNDMMPITSFRFEKPNFFGWGVIIIQHHNLNLPSKPCNALPSYSFTACVKTFLSHDIGCRLPWDTWTDQAWPVCQTLEQFRCTELFKSWKIIG